MNLEATISLLAYGTSEGVEKEWDERGRGRKSAYHTTSLDNANKILKEGIHVGHGGGTSRTGGTKGRKPSVYFTGNLKDAHKYGEMLRDNDNKYAVVEFKHPTDAKRDNWDKEVKTSSSVTHPIGPKDIVAVHVFKFNQGKIKPVRVIRP